MIDRRHLLIALGAAGISPRIALAQSKKAPIVIGWLSPAAPASFGQSFAAFKEALVARRVTQVTIEERWADGRVDLLASLARELAAKRPAIIVAVSVPAAVAGAKAAPEIPIVVIGGNPVAAGLAASHSRPGGMLTGIASLTSDVSEKYLELLLAAAPNARRVGFLVDVTSANLAAFMNNVRRSVAQHQVEATYAEAARLVDIEPALARLAKERVQALVVLPSPGILHTERQRIVDFARKQRWPVIGSTTEWADEGALLSYGVNTSDSYRRAAYFVERILKGAKPGDLPIEQPTKIELVVNLKTAKALGLTLPQPFLMRTDRVIE